MKYSQQLIRSFLMCCLLFLGLTQVACGTNKNEVFFLITEEEAAADDAKDIFIRKADGPEIIVHKPDSKTPFSGPISMHIEFVPGKNGQAVNMKTLIVRYKKFEALNITNRFSEFVTDNKILIPEFDLPSGRHNLEFSIRDSSGKWSSQLISIRRNES